jgi:hypothetical protein
MGAEGSLTYSQGCAPLVPVLHQMRPIHTVITFEIRFNNIVTPTLACHVVFRLGSRDKIFYVFFISLMPEHVFLF